MQRRFAAVDAFAAGIATLWRHAADSGFGGLFYFGLALGRPAPIGADESTLIFYGLLKLVPGFNLVDVIIAELFSTFKEVLLNGIENFADAFGEIRFRNKYLFAGVASDHYGLMVFNIARTDFNS